MLAHQSQDQSSKQILNLKVLSTRRVTSRMKATDKWTALLYAFKIQCFSTQNRMHCSMNLGVCALRPKHVRRDSCSKTANSLDTQCHHHSFCTLQHHRPPHSTVAVLRREESVIVQKKKRWCRNSLSDYRTIRVHSSEESIY